MFRASPIFGVEYEYEDISDPVEHSSAQVEPLEEGDESEVIDAKHRSDAFVLYFADSNKVRLRVCQHTYVYLF